MARSTNRVEEAFKATSLTKLARETNTAPSFISMLFHGKRGARVDTLERIAGALGVGLVELHDYLKGVRKSTKRTPRSAPATQATSVVDAAA